MLIGSSNSLTYTKPSNVWLGFLARFGKSQEVPYDEQYTYWGVRMFDIRLYVNKHGHAMVKNGKYEYPLYSLYQILDYMNRRGDVSVIITLDAEFRDRMMESYAGVEDKFKEICNILDTIYKDIFFFGGTRKFDNKLLYEFRKREDCNMTDTIYPEDWSPIYRFVSKWMPFLIGKMNNMYIKKFKDKHVFLMLNYVNRR
jgi:hypothetical protein